MKGYITAFTIAAAIASLPLGFLLVVNVANLNALALLFLAGLLALFWGSCWLLRRKKRFAFGISFSLAAIIWLPLLYQTTRRIHFVVENGGMERADGQGSPLAFLLGLVIEQSLFIPLSAVIALGVVQLLGPNKPLR